LLLSLLLLLLSLQLRRAGSNRAISADQDAGATGTASSNTTLGPADLGGHVISQLFMIMGELFLGLNLGLFMGELGMHGLHAGEKLRLRRELLHCLLLCCRLLLLHKLLLLL
jgi:hypothetical protein